MHKYYIGLNPNPRYFILQIELFQVLFRLRRSDIIAKAIVLLKPFGFRVILFALNCRRQYNYAKHNITAKQYHSLNVIRRIKLRDFLIRSLAMATSFYYNISLSFEITSSVLSMRVLLELNSSAETLAICILCA